MYRGVITFCLSFLLLTTLYADNFEINNRSVGKRAWYPVISVGGALINVHIAQTQTLSGGGDPQVRNIYTPQHLNTNEILFSLVVGAEYLVNNSFITQFGLSYSIIPSNNVTGTLQQSLGTASNNYNYQYAITTQQVLAEGKLLYKLNKHILPYVSLGLGTAFNHAGNYSATPENETAGPAPVFAAHDQTNFSYSLALGVEIPIQSQLRVGIGYQYSNFGSLSLASQNNSGQLQNKNYYANAVLAKLTYLF